MTQWHHLKTERTSVVIASLDGGVPAIFYWGQRLSDALSIESLALLQSRPNPSGFLDAVPPLSLVPEAGRGFLGEAGLSGHRDQTAWGGQFQLTELADVCDGQVRVRCHDETAGLELELYLSLDADTDVLTMNARLTNRGDTDYDLQHLGISTPLPERTAELVTFHGRWIQEFLTERGPWPKHKVVRENRRGRTSHDSFPGVIAGTRGFGEAQGEVWGLHLAYSGNHRWVAERLTEGGRHIQFGEWLYPGEMRLAPGEAYTTPTLYGAWSDTGLNGMSHCFHRHLRRRILDLDVRERPRPVHFNTWEGVYFDHQPKPLLAMVEQAARIGVERFILDDGWFGRRDDDTAGLGDWYVDERKHPGGLGYLIDAVRDHGMNFGLWFEPEMVNPDSDLYRKHPDWVLQVDGYSQPLGRHQMVLDLSRPEVEEYLYERLHDCLARYDIDCIKWDMNRDLTQPGHQGRPSVHRQTRALYRLLERVRTAHPEVEIESCASGGGRIDFEILRHTQRVWTSDCIDARERQRIQQAFTLFLPPEIMGSHISENPAHTTGRQHSLGYRLITAMFGHMGLELDVMRLTEAEQTQVADLVERYKTHRSLLHTGDFHRLETDDPALQAYGVVSEDRRQALFAATALTLPEQIVTAPLRLTGLAPNQTYRVRLWLPEGAHGPEDAPSELTRSGGGCFSSELLQQIGLQLPTLNPESAMLIELQATDAA